MSVNALVDQAMYTQPAHTKYDLTQVTENFSNLRPKLSTYIHNDGSESVQVVLEGTIPIVYQGATYNIPMDIFIMLQHPVEVPKCFVRPTSNMMIKPAHSFVNADGLVSTDHVLRMTGSSAQQYNFTDFLYAMSQMFGSEPPLFTKPQPQFRSGTVEDAYTHSPATRSNSRVQVNPPLINPGNSAAGYNVGQQYHALGARPQAPVCSNGTQGCGGLASTTTCGLCYMSAMAQQTPKTPETRNSGASASLLNSAKSDYSTDSETSRNNNNTDAHITSHGSRADLERKLTEKLQIALVSRFSKKRDDLEQVMHEEESMKRATEAVDKQFAVLESMKNDLETGLEGLRLKAVELEKLKASENDKEVSLEDRLVSFDALSSQIVKLTADQAAIEDCIYYLERALASASNPSVEISDFVFQTRKLSRELFMRKHHLNKIAVILREQQEGSSSNKDSG